MEGADRGGGVVVEAPWVRAQTELPAGKSQAAFTPTSANPQAEVHVESNRLARIKCGPKIKSLSVPN